MAEPPCLPNKSRHLSKPCNNKARLIYPAACRAGGNRFRSAVLFVGMFCCAFASFASNSSAHSLRSHQHDNYSSAVDHSTWRRFLQGAINATITVNGTSTTNDEAFCSVYCPPPPPAEEWISAVPVPVQYILIILLVCMSAMFSGLTLGLMGLDKTGLEIVMEGEDEANAKAAKIIYPVRKKGNQLLCTLLLGNTAVNALLSILMADKAGGIVGFLISTITILILGEIVPQAVCSRFALKIGSCTVPIVRVIMLLLSPLTIPLAFVLDKCLGQELATTYSSAEMLKLLQIHVQEEILDPDTAVAMTGALTFKNMTVAEVMTPLKNAFLLDVDEKLNFETIAKIFKTGYSRIPVYEVSQNNIIGLLFVKDLIFIDPEDETPIRNFIQIFGRGVHVVWPGDKLGDVLRELKQGRSHMALVRDVNNEDETQDPFYEIKGIITLEDIIEEILGHEILDETDAFVDGSHRVKVNRTEGFEWARLRLLGSKIVDEHLSFTETKAITAHLLANYPNAVALLTENQIHRLVSETAVTIFPTATREVGQDLPKDLLYAKGVPSDVCTLILAGRVTVIAGADEFRSDVSIWTVLAVGALHAPDYKPDFTAFVASGPCRCLQFSRELFVKCLDASVLEKHAIQNDSLRHIVPSQAHAAPSAHEGLTSDYSEGGSEHNATRRDDRKNKFFAALQIASGSATDLSASQQQHHAATTTVGFADASSMWTRTSINEALGLGVYQPKQEGEPKKNSGRADDSEMGPRESNASSYMEFPRETGDDAGTSKNDGKKSGQAVTGSSNANSDNPSNAEMGADAPDSTDNNANEEVSRLQLSSLLIGKSPHTP